MSIRASISITKIQASVATEQITASTSYIKSTATDIWVDPDSKNKTVREEIPLSEVLVVAYTKPLDDGYTVTEFAELHITKSAEDSLATSDEFSKVVEFTRNFNDQVLPHDVKGGTAFSTFGLNESTLNKPVSSNVAIGIDSISMDTMGVSDVPGVIVSKPLFDSFALDDSALINRDFTGNKGNVMSVVDQVDISIYSMSVVGTSPLNTITFN